jgi:hypothetical protein
MSSFVPLFIPFEEDSSMSRSTNKVLAGVAALALLGGSLGTSVASATPDPNSAMFVLRIFNDCAFSTVTPISNYPASVVIDETGLNCSGFANLHAWRFSEDGVSQAQFNNDAAFSYSATLVVSGTVEGESGLQVAPWWSQADGRLNVRTTDGEIACFGGRLPFYSFTGNHGLHYVKGTPIYLEITYLPNGLSAGDPATIEYVVGYGGNIYSSGPLAFDEGNPNEDPPYGLWGMLNDGKVGGHVQPFLQAGNPNATFRAEWSEITFDSLKPVSVDASSWGNIKNLYR